MVIGWEKFLSKAKECIKKLQDSNDLDYRIEQVVLSKNYTFEVEVDRNYLEGFYDEDDNFIENDYYGTITDYHFSILRGGKYVESISENREVKYIDIDLKYIYNCALAEG